MMRERYSWRKSICRCLIMVAPRAGQYRQTGPRCGPSDAGGLLLEHDLFRKPVPTFRDHALLLEHDLFRKPAPAFRDHALIYHTSITARRGIQSADGAGRVPSITRATAEFRRASSGLPAKIISPRSMT